MLSGGINLFTAEFDSSYFTYMLKKIFQINLSPTGKESALMKQSTSWGGGARNMATRQKGCK